MTTHELRESFSTKLLSSCTKQEAAECMALLEEMVKDSQYDVDPGRVWMGERNDTLLGFLGDKLVGALCLRMVPAIDPLILDADQVPFAALFLKEMLSRAEGCLVQLRNTEYVFAVPLADREWLKEVRRFGGMESLTEVGFEMFRRKL